MRVGVHKVAIKRRATCVTIRSVFSSGHLRMLLMSVDTSPQILGMCIESYFVTHDDLAFISLSIQDDMPIAQL